MFCLRIDTYIPTVKKIRAQLQLEEEELLKTSAGEEPPVLWWAVFLGCLFAIYPAWVRSDLFAWIYLGRAIPSTALVIFLIWRIEKRLEDLRDL